MDLISTHLLTRPSLLPLITLAGWTYNQPHNEDFAIYKVTKPEIPHEIIAITKAGCWTWEWIWIQFLQKNCPTIPWTSFNAFVNSNGLLVHARHLFYTFDLPELQLAFMHFWSQALLDIMFHSSCLLIEKESGPDRAMWWTKVSWVTSW